MNKMQCVTVGYLDNNCYLVLIGSSLYVIDPAADAPVILAKIRESFPHEKAAILLTHAHADHLGAVGEVARELAAGYVMLDPGDLALYENPANSILPWIPHPDDLPETVPAADRPDFRVIRTPGHTPGGVCYFFPELPALFSGDTLFYQSVGRTDLPGGDAALLTKCIRERIFTLPDALAVYPGHGPATTVGGEKTANPYVRG